MSHKVAGLLLIAILTLSFFPTSVHAVSIQIDQSGAVRFYQDSVLGDNDSVEDNESEEKTQESKQEEKKNEEEKRKNESEQQKEQKKKEMKAEKVISPREGKKERLEVKVKPVSKEKSKIEIKSKMDDDSSSILDESEVERFEMEFDDKDGQLRKLRVENQSELQKFKLELDRENPPNKAVLLKNKEIELSEGEEMKREEIISALTPRPQNPQEFKEEQKSKLPPRPGISRTPEQIQQRQENLMKLRDAVQDNSREIRLEGSDGAVARFLQGTQITVDAETGTVSLTTPTGETKTLNNFPEDVFEKLKNSGNFTSDDSNEIEVVVGDDGKIQHLLKKVEQKKRFLGLFSRSVSGEAVLDDETGSVEFTPAQTSPLNSLLNAFSF